MLIYAEDFSSPLTIEGTYSWDTRRIGGNGISAIGRWHSSIVPYLEYHHLSFIEAEDGSRHLGYVGNDSYVSGGGSTGNPRVFLPASRNLTVGWNIFLTRDFGTSSSYTQFARLEFVFRSYIENSTTFLENFTVRILMDSDGRAAADRPQKAQIEFETGGTGYPDIAPVTVYYDFLEKPIFVWVQCDMSSVNPGGANGVCRVWFNNDLVAVKEDIYTGDVDEWAAQPLYEFNNYCRMTVSWGRNRGRRSWELLSVAAVNEGLSYMDSALGEINIAGLLPETIAQSQWGAHLDGEDLETDSVDVLEDALHTDYADLHTVPHIRADEHLARDMYQHQQPFNNDTHIIAVAHRIVHRKYDIGSGTTVLRVEPVIHTSGRDPLMDRSKGQLSEGNAKTLFVNYTIPYAGAFWSKEILDLTTFGFALYDAARPEYLPDGIDLLGEYDVENLDDSIEMEVLAQDDDYLLGGTIRTHILAEEMDLDIEAIDGDTI